MIKYLIFGICVISLFIIVSIIRNNIRKKDIFKLLEKNSNRYKLIKSKNKIYDYVLKTKNKDIYLKTIYVPKYSQITINSKETWKLSWNTFKEEKGRSYSNNKYINELEYFLSNDIRSNVSYLKVIMIYKNTESIVRYLNESELDVIDISKSPYGYKITTFNSFESDLDNLLE